MNIDNFITNLLDGKKKKTNIVDQLYKIPVKDKKGDAPTFDHINPGYIQQADLLHLPNDKGYIYALVVTDQGSRLVDAEPLKGRKVTDILKALNKIYDRKILDKPHQIVTDSGKEFGKLFTSTLKKIDIAHHTTEPGRHRQVALVERKNQTIGKIIHRVLTQAEVADYHSSQWVEYLPLIITKINEKVKSIEMENENKDKETDSKKSILPEDESITFNPDHKIKMLKVGDHVRVQLDNPIDVNGNKLHGTFRSGDIRWNPKVRTISDVLVKPGQPIMYQLDDGAGNGHTAYTYNQLQKVSPRENIEVRPLIPVEADRTQVKEILERGIDEDNQVWYKVHWKNERKNQATWQTRENLLGDLGKAYMDRIDAKIDKK
mmetsp:Transcript_7123/g.7469  ORF Transcript_7123/g.7469 Transcript_7123/m.7469 type:complete len:375 (+) Transcript_7123:2-1126(+)